MNEDNISKDVIVATLKARLKSALDETNKFELYSSEWIYWHGVCSGIYKISIDLNVETEFISKE